MRSRYDLFTDHQEWFAAGFYKNESHSYMQRHADALCEYLDKAPLCPYEPGSCLYPSGNNNYWNTTNTLRICFEYSFSISIIDSLPPADLEEMEKINWEKMLREMNYIKSPDMPEKYAIGGSGYTHSVINYERVLADGLLKYMERIETARAKNDSDFLAAIQRVLDAIIRRHARELEYLKTAGAPAGLINAFARVPLYPAQTLEEAFVAFNYMWYVDGNDSMGRSDKVLGKYCRPDEYAKAEEYFAALWKNSDVRFGWHTIWGNDLEMTRAAIRAQRNFCRPNSGCLVSAETPDWLWDEIFDSWATGNPSPALYSRSNYTPEVIKKLNLRPGDENWYCYGGCTELMVEGRSNVGSIDCGINILDILTTLDIAAFADYESFYNAFVQETLLQIDLSMDSARLNHRKMAECRPQLIRSLFTDDCIDNNTEYNAGGARYNAFVCNVAGLSNVINSLYALKKVYAGEMEFSIAELQNALYRNFEGCENVRQQLLALPKFGNDNPEVDAVAAELSRKVFGLISSRRGVRGNGPYYGGIILFQTFVPFGSYVPATPDGRHDGEALCDCAGAVQGTDLNGPTSLLNSTAKLDQRNGLGTIVLNLRINKQNLQDVELRKKLKSLILAYFAMGGLQIQPTIADQEILQKAIENPEKYPDLIIRIGGYSVYFKNLSHAERVLVAKRMEHSF